MNVKCYKFKINIKSFLRKWKKKKNLDNERRERKRKRKRRTSKHNINHKKRGKYNIKKRIYEFKKNEKLKRKAKERTRRGNLYTLRPFDTNNSRKSRFVDSWFLQQVVYTSIGFSCSIQQLGIRGTFSKFLSSREYIL